jgi:transcriptional regulator with XRE-family HTH domain
MPKNRLFSQFGQEIRRRREALNLTIEQFAERAELTVGFVGSIENGLRDPSLSTLTKLAHGLGISMGVLLGPGPPLSREAFDFAKLFDKAPRDIQAGQLLILRSAAKLEPKAPAPPSRPGPG